jgi:large subunit ribosomal protein L21
MYAVIESGGKQYRVEPGDVIDVEITLVSDDKKTKIGSPVVKGAKVTGVLVDEVRGPKIRVFKMKRRKGYRRTQGHRQNLLRVKIDNIKG